MTLQGFVRELHRKRGLSQTQIAKKSGLSQGLIYKMLAGIGTPQIRTYRSLASAFPDEWNDYLQRHPAFRRELSAAFGWAATPKPFAGSEHDELFELIIANVRSDQLRRLPPEYWERYRERALKSAYRLLQELEAHRKELEAEFRASQRKKRTI